MKKSRPWELPPQALLDRRVLSTFRRFSKSYTWPWNLGLGTFEDIKKGTIRKLGYSFILAFHSDYGSILHHFGDNARYLSKIAVFSYPLAFDAPLGGPRRTIAIPFSRDKPEWCDYLTVKKV